MLNMKWFWRQFISDWNTGFKSHMRTVILFVVFSTLWIFGSDYFFAVLFSDLKVYAMIQSSKGMLYVIVTAVFLVFLLYTDYKRITYYMVNAERKRLRLDNPVKAGLRYTFRLINELMTDDQSDIKSSSIDVFKEIFEHLEGVDMGSVYVVTDKNVEYIHTVGYDMDLLNNLPFLHEEFQVFSFNHSKNLSQEKQIRKILGKSNYEKYSKSSSAIAESVSVAFRLEDDLYLGMSFDISKMQFDTTKHGFSENEIRELKELQILLNATIDIRKYNTEKKVIQKDIVNTFIHAMEYHDFSSEGHSQEVADLSHKIGVELGLSQSELEDLKWASLLHDIGKLVIPFEILNKVMPLTTAERNIINEHASVGASFLVESESVKHIAKFIRHHHERYDGTGYPSGLEGVGIPLISRIISLTDAWHAITNSRPYKEKLEFVDAIEEIESCKGTQFCPEVVDAFLRIINEKDR
ncbi:MULTISPECIES: HD-GYP domain-containing protein [unclassified Fusibacter]|uniref:HD-GYP domain-containing protein n=1 Tax=unclassified Fusibacter TaxID=2624464 RepID=UPI00101283C5|nr:MULTISPECIES: HD-GYP domain-containing protein [unclassified Fusibacter]MCK8058622.1 HD-GYP domain-containing protein [Fusibacter sp. A2]NPE21697.1 HD-GYP domain-containing protein [Fusibacter sp. A1]RXV61272.1 HD-GYP domain-containing protein [Fusibacter sp. A1]